MDNWYRRLRNLAQWPKKDPPAAAAAPEETPTNWTSPDLERKITLEEGLYRVIYTDNKEVVPDNMTLYYNNKLIGTLAEIKAKSRGRGGNSMVYNKDGDEEGTVDYLKDKLTARPGRKITLEEGLNRVIYTDNKEAVPDNMTLYYNNKLIGTLAEIKAKGRVLGLGNNMVYNKDGDKEGTVDYLKDKLTARPLTNGGKRKSRRNRKSKKLKKNCKKSNRRR